MAFYIIVWRSSIYAAAILEKPWARRSSQLKLDPKSVDYHLLLAGLYSSLGENQKGIGRIQRGLKARSKNQEALLYLGALYLQTDETWRATKLR